MLGLGKTNHSQADSRARCPRCQGQGNDRQAGQCHRMDTALSSLQQPRRQSNLWLLADYAEKLEVRLVIEPMSRFRNHLINTSKQAVQLAEMAGHHNVMINLDTFHMITEERDYGAAITCTSSRLWGIHACENDRGAPGGGLVPWPTVFESLQKVAGPVRVMLETYRTGPEGFGFERGIFQDLCPKPEEFVEKGIGYLKSVVDQIRNV